MTGSATIKVGRARDISWIRVDGRGDVFLAPTVKKFTDAVFSKNGKEAESVQKVVIDMEDCTGMDSTFMGMIAGLAIKLQKMKDSCLFLCGVNKQNKNSLEELGIDSLVEINPDNEELGEQAQEARKGLSEWTEEKAASPDAKLILETHESLGSLNEENEKEFSSVIETFKSQIE